MFHAAYILHFSRTKLMLKKYEILLSMLRMPGIILYPVRFPLSFFLPLFFFFLISVIILFELSGLLSFIRPGFFPGRDSGMLPDFRQNIP